MTSITLDEYRSLKKMWRRLTTKNIEGKATLEEAKYADELRRKLLHYEESTP